MWASAERLGLKAVREGFPRAIRDRYLAAGCKQHQAFDKLGSQASPRHTFAERMTDENRRAATETFDHRGHVIGQVFQGHAHQPAANCNRNGAGGGVAAQFPWKMGEAFLTKAS